MKAAHKNVIVLLAGFIIVFAALVIDIYSHDQINNADFIVNEFETNLDYQSKYLQNEALKFTSILNENTDDYWPLFERVDESESYYTFIFENDKLLYWNNSSIFLNNLLKSVNPFLVNHSSNWYLGCYAGVGMYDVWLLKPIISDYSVENQHVKRIIDPEFSSFEHINITDHKVHNSYELDFSEPKDYYLEIKSNNVAYDGSLHLFLLLVLAYFLFTLISINFIQYFIAKNTNSIYNLLLSFVIILLVRILDWYFGISSLFIPSELFQHHILAIPILSSLGDLLIISMIVLIFSIYYYQRSILKNSIEQKAIVGAIQFVYLILLILIPYVILVISSEIINDYGITELYFFFIDFPGFIFTIILVIFGLVLYLVLRVFGVLLSYCKINLLSVVLTLVLSISLVLLLNSKTLPILMMSILLSTIAIVLEFYVTKRKTFYVLHHLIYIIIISAVFSLVINQTVELNKSTQQTNVSNFLSQSGDKTIENFWDKLQDQFESDAILSSILESSELDEDGQVSTYLLDYYLNNVNQDIDFQVTVCANTDMLDLENEGLIVNCNEFFQDMTTNSLKSIDSNLFLISSEPDNIYYLALYQLSEVNSVHRILFILCSNRIGIC